MSDEAQRSLTVPLKPDGSIEPLLLKTGALHTIVLELVIEILIIGEDEEPLANVAVALRRDDNMELLAKSDRDGVARFTGLERNRKYRFSLYARDKDAWEMKGSDKAQGGESADTEEAEWQPIPENKDEAKTHVVKQGDCIDSIAFQYGFFPEALWEHEDNSDLKKLRENPNILMEGDEVKIPALRQKEESAEIGKQYKVKTIGVPSRFRIASLTINGEVVSNAPYTLEIDTALRVLEGTTGAHGEIDHSMPPDATKAILRVADHEFTFMLGTVDPIDTREGLIQRLYNLGYLDEDSLEDPDFEGELEDAIFAFQESQEGLTPTGKPDDDTRRALEQAYGG